MKIKKYNLLPGSGVYGKESWRVFFRLTRSFSSRGGGSRGEGVKPGEA